MGRAFGVSRDHRRYRRQCGIHDSRARRISAAHPEGIAMSDLSHCLAVLKALGISEVVYSLSGGGDEGTCEIDSVVHLDGRTTQALPALSIGINDHGQVTTLEELLDGIVPDIPDGDWVNNEGGYGTVVLRPQETDEDLRVECDMTYGDESDAEDFDDDDEFTAAGIDEQEPDPASTTLTIDDSALQPPEGTKP
jgi:hypothetical protein